MLTVVDARKQGFVPIVNHN
jgi:hypothetical protein